MTDSPPRSVTLTVPAAQRGWLWSRLAVADLLLFTWAAVAQPLLFRSSAAPEADLFVGRPDVLLGVLHVLAASAAVLALLSRDPERAADAEGRSAEQERELSVAGPTSAGILFVYVTGFELFGEALPDWLILLVFGAAFIGIFVRRWLPPVSGVARRALVTPFVMVAAGMFDQATATTDRLLDLRLLSEVRAGDDLGPLALVAGIAVAVSAFYYAVLIFAPRRLAGDDAPGAVWVLRYSIFLLSVVIGVTLGGLLAPG